MSNHKGVLIAGVLSGLLIISLLVAGLGNIKAVANNNSTAVPQPTQQTQQISNVSDQEALQAWQQYSAELEQAVLTLQSRENNYRTQIDLANQTILQLQDQLNAANNSTSRGFEHDDD